MKKFLIIILGWLTRQLVAKYQPTVIGITGSVGKTSTKEAIFAVCQSSVSVRKSSKNYNNELGLPLTVIGADSGGSRLAAWFGVLGKALGLL